MALMSQSYVTSPDLALKMYGTGKEDISVTNECGVPHIWTGDCDIAKVQTKGTLLDKVDLTKGDEIGFADLTPGGGHGTGGYSYMGWIEVYGKAVKRDATR
jgi:hypothetical protein